MNRIFLFVACVVFAGPAFAHVTANPNSGAAGSYFETGFRVSHGCRGSDTNRVSIKIPEGLIVAKPQAKAGWTVEVKKTKLPAPIEGPHGKMIGEKVEEIVWRGGLLKDGEYDTFGILMKLPEKAGETLWFPVMQTCTDDFEEWNEIPKDGQQWHELKAPAPFVKIEAAPASTHKH